MRWPTLLLVGLLTGCATAPDNPWQNIETDSEAATRPVPLPGWPEPVAFDAETVTFDISGARRLDAFREVAIGNQAIAEANADQVDELNESANALVEAGNAQHELTMIQREILNEERRRHAIEKVTLYLGIVALIFAL